MPTTDARTGGTRTGANPLNYREWQEYLSGAREPVKTRAEKRQSEQETGADDTLKERAKERQRSQALDRLKKKARKVILYSVIAATAVAGEGLYNVFSHDPGAYGSPSPIVLENEPVGRRPENLKMIEYIDKDTNLMEAEFKVIEQSKHVEANTVLLNGLTDKGYWYQGGVRITDANQIVLRYDFFNDKGKIYNSGNVRFNEEVSPGDTFHLELEIKDGVIRINAKDLNNGAYANKTTEAVGNAFVANKESDENGFSTSIFREMWVRESYNTTSIISQNIELVYPKIETAYLSVDREIYAKDSDTYGDAKPQAATGYDFGRVDLSTEPRYLIPESPDSLLNHINVTASGNVFYTQGR